MIVYRDKDFEDGGPVRTHPYLNAQYDASFRYYDFRQNPELIRTNLEDFKDLEPQPAIQTFYELLEWINSSDDSVFESNDSGIRPPKPLFSTNTSKKALELNGRLMILFRELKFNTIEETTEWLRGATEHYLKHIDPDRTTDRVIGLSYMEAAFEALGHEIGRELVITWWVFDDTEVELFGNLDRLFRNLSKALKLVSGEVKESLGSRIV